MKKNVSTPATNDLLSTEDLVMMSCDDVQKYMAKQKEKYLSMHTAPITQGKGSDKRWTTRVPDKNKPDGRRVIRKPTKEDGEKK